MLSYIKFCAVPYIYIYKYISVVDDFFDQWYSSTATPMEEVCGPKWGLC